MLEQDDRSLEHELHSLRTDIHTNFPKIEIKRLEKIGEGMDYRVYRINDHITFRVPKYPAVNNTLQSEVVLLPQLESFVHTPIPRYRYLGIQNDTKFSFVGYQNIQGDLLPAEKLWLMPVKASPSRQANALASQPSAFLTLGIPDPRLD